MIYQFEFEKKRLIALAVCVPLLGIILFSCGLVVGILVSRQPLPVAVTRPHFTPSSAPSTPAPAKNAELSPQAASAPVANAPASSAGSASGTALQLAVQIGTFADPGRAKHVAEELQKQGFSPIIAPGINGGNQQTSVVEVGPFSAWEDASQVAQLIGRSLGTRPAIRPML